MKENKIFTVHRDIPNKEAAQAKAYSLVQDEHKMAAYLNALAKASNKENMRMSWVVSKCVDINKESLIPFTQQLVDILCKSDSTAVQRNILRVFQVIQPQNDDQMGRLIDRAFSLFENLQSPIAVRVFAMTVLAKSCEKFPELKADLIFLIEQYYPHGSAGYKSRKKKLLKKLKD